MLFPMASLGNINSLGRLVMLWKLWKHRFFCVIGPTLLCVLEDFVYFCQLFVYGKPWFFGHEILLEIHWVAISANP
jgi:hypothetical protein